MKAFIHVQGQRPPYRPTIILDTHALQTEAVTFPAQIGATTGNLGAIHSLLGLNHQVGRLILQMSAISHSRSIHTIADLCCMTDIDRTGRKYTGESTQGLISTPATSASLSFQTTSCNDFISHSLSSSILGYVERMYYNPDVHYDTPLVGQGMKLISQLLPCGGDDIQLQEVSVPLHILFTIRSMTAMD